VARKKRKEDLINKLVKRMQGMKDDVEPKAGEEASPRRIWQTIDAPRQ